MTAVLTEPFSKSRVHPVNHFTWYSGAEAWAGELLGAASVGITVGAQGKAGTEGSEGPCSTIIPVLWSWGFSVQAFCEFSFFFFFPQASSRQDKLLLQQMTYINVNEHLMCT